MSGIVLTGHGGPEKLEWRDDLPLPQISADEVLIRVGASALNNTDINTRIGWYSKAVTGATDATTDTNADDASWSGTPLQFPRIQGADCCGTIVAVGEGVDPARIGTRVLVRTMQTRGAGDQPWITWTLGSECDGGFAQYMKAFDVEACAINSPLPDTDLASFPCAFTTAEGMIQRCNLGTERVLITGASGGVGAAAIQLAKRRGAHVTAITTADKADALRRLGADATLTRDAPYGSKQFDVVLDLVAGPRFPDLLEALDNGGRYVASGAIAGPLVELDVRTLYLKDLTLIGSTYQRKNILPDLIGYIEAGEIKPTVSAIYDLADIHAAQKAFLSKTHVGKIAIRVP